jgi:hypothetical protein
MIDQTQQQIRDAVASFGLGAAGPTALAFKGMLLRMESHELTREYAAAYCDPSTGFNLATALTFRAFGSDSWRPGGSKLRSLAEAGVDVNRPDAHGRVASLQGFSIMAPLIDGNDIDWAVRHGMDPLCVEYTSEGSRSLLSLHFGESGAGDRTPEFWRQVQVKVNTALRKAEKQTPGAARDILGRLAQTPIYPAHHEWLANHKLKLLEQGLSRGEGVRSKPRL